MCCGRSDAREENFNRPHLLARNLSPYSSEMAHRPVKPASFSVSPGSAGTSVSSPKDSSPAPSFCVDPLYNPGFRDGFLL
jgi:hypothetical protein